MLLQPIPKVGVKFPGVIFVHSHRLLNQLYYLIHQLAQRLLLGSQMVNFGGVSRINQLAEALGEGGRLDRQMLQRFPQLLFTREIDAIQRKEDLDQCIYDLLDDPTGIQDIQALNRAQVMKILRPKSSFS